MRQVRNILRYLVVFILNIFVMVAFHSYINFLLLFGLILFPIYSIYGLFQVKNNLKFDISMPLDSMEKGKEFHVRFTVHNPTYFPLVNATVCLEIANGFYQERGEQFLNIPVRARKDTEIIYPIEMDYCGRLEVKATEIRLTDLMGIYNVSLPVSEQKECLVVPCGQERTEEAGRIYMKGVAEAMESKEKGYDFSEVSGIREYIPGDKLQNIHWKLSVKKDELMVKERISVSAMQLNVVIELVNDENMCLEAVLELTDSVTKGFVSQNLPFTVFYYSSNQGKMIGNYIGSEIERQKWMELLLYDSSYMEADRAQALFVKEYQNQTSYLYIGKSDSQEDEGMIIGQNGIVAVLRT